MKLTVRPLSPRTWPDLEAVFNARGCSVARGCWCMYYRESGAQAVPEGERLRDVRRRRLAALAAEEAPVGLVGYRGKEPVGWVSFAPHEDYVKLARSPVLRPVDGQPVWSIVCFVVPAQFRSQGVARQLLAAVVAFARRRKIVLEAYPVDRAGRSGDDTMWFGAKSMFDAAGFREVARRKPERPIVRLHPA